MGPADRTIAGSAIEAAVSNPDRKGVGAEKPIVIMGSNYLNDIEERGGEEEGGGRVFFNRLLP